jgi:hypothetical protein
MSVLTTVCASEFILLDHHPDLSRRPEARPGLVEAENRRAALTWNCSAPSNSSHRPSGCDGFARDWMPSRRSNPAPGVCPFVCGGTFFFTLPR